MKKYLDLIGKELNDNPTLEIVEKTLLLAIGDFKDGKIFPSELSEVCSYLWPISLEISNFNKEASELSRVLLIGAEMEYYLKNKTNKEHSKIYDTSLKDVLSYKPKFVKEEN